MSVSDLFSKGIDNDGDGISDRVNQMYERLGALDGDSAQLLCSNFLLVRGDVLCGHDGKEWTRI